jgi:hypothetical protein
MFDEMLSKKVTIFSPGLLSVCSFSTGEAATANKRLKVIESLMTLIMFFETSVHKMLNWINL